MTIGKVDKHIKLVSSRDPFKSGAAIKTELELEVSARIVRKRLVKQNIFGSSTRKVPILTKRHRRNRLIFAKPHKDWDGPVYRKKVAQFALIGRIFNQFVGNDGKHD